MSANNSHCHDFVPKEASGNSCGRWRGYWTRSSDENCTDVRNRIFHGIICRSLDAERFGAETRRHGRESQEKVGLGELMSGTAELVMAYGIMSAIIAFYVNHLRSRIVFLSSRISEYSTSIEEE